MSNTDWIELPPPERTARYRELAKEMRSCAARAASEEARTEYLKIAVEWLDMADGIEAEYGKVSVTIPAPALASLLRRRSSPDSSR